MKYFLKTTRRSVNDARSIGVWVKVRCKKLLSFFIYSFYCFLLLTLTHTPPSLARWLDTLHVVLSGQGYRPSKPKGLHTGFSGLPLIAVKGGPSYM